MNITGQYLKTTTDDNGNIEATFKLNSYQDKAIAKSLNKDEYYNISLTPNKSLRTVDQNRLMWAIIHEIAINRGTERANDDWDIYLEALEKTGAKYEYIAVLPQAEQMLKDQFRAIKKMNSFDFKGKEMNCYKVFYGSSKMNTKEMSLLLETVLDMASYEGVIIKDYYE